MARERERGVERERWEGETGREKERDFPHNIPLNKTAQRKQKQASKPRSLPAHFTPPGKPLTPATQTRPRLTPTKS